MPKTKPPIVVQVSPRGGVTLPAEARKVAGIQPGDTLVVTVEDGRILLQPAVVVPIERYTDKRVREFAESAEMSEAEVKRAKRKWGV